MTKKATKLDINNLLREKGPLCRKQIKEHFLKENTLKDDNLNKTQLKLKINQFKTKVDNKIDHLKEKWQISEIAHSKTNENLLKIFFGINWFEPYDKGYVRKEKPSYYINSAIKSKCFDYFHSWKKHLGLHEKKNLVLDKEIDKLGHLLTHFELSNQIHELKMVEYPRLKKFPIIKKGDIKTKSRILNSKKNPEAMVIQGHKKLDRFIDILIGSRASELTLNKNFGETPEKNKNSKRKVINSIINYNAKKRPEKGFTNLIFHQANVVIAMLKSIEGEDKILEVITFKQNDCSKSASPLRKTWARLLAHCNFRSKRP